MQYIKNLRNSFWDFFILVLELYLLSRTIQYNQSNIPHNLIYMNILLNILVSALAVAIAAYITPGVSVDGYLTAIMVAIVLAIINSTIGIFLKVLTFPINILTLGLVSIIINVLMVLLVARIVPWFRVDGFFIALIFAIILALVNMVLGGGGITRK